MFNKLLLINLILVDQAISTSQQLLLKILCPNNYVCIVIRILMYVAYVAVAALNIHLRLYNMDD
jgi:hypothetical protein